MCSPPLRDPWEVDDEPERLARRASRPPPWRIGFCATGSPADENDLTEAEGVLVVGASPTRRSEFATGRWCARAALAQVGAGAGRPLLRDDHGAPSWPTGYVGSITHTAGWTAAVATGCRRRSGIRSIGLDAEAAGPLPPGVLDVVASRREQADLERLATLDPDTAWDTVLFTAKEATYKAWYPLTGVVLAHDDIDVHLRADGRFDGTARATAAGPRTTHRVRGRWGLGPGVVVSLGVVD